MTVAAPLQRPNSLLPRSPAPWRPGPSLGLPAAVQSLLQQLGGTFHTYHPFRRPPGFNELSSGDNSPTDGATEGNTITPSPLLLLCRNALISSFGLRNLRRVLMWAGAPRAVSRLICTVGAGECEALGAAPLTDVFAQPFFHRAVTWRVTCCLDRQPYLTTYAATSATYGYCIPWGGWHWLGWTAESWFWVDHAHIMSIWGVVYDDVTGNAFYLLDTPIATLDQIQTRLTACGRWVEEELVWTVVFQVAAALLHMVENDLQYTPLTLDNIFLLKDRIALENMLSRKHRMTGCGCEAWRGAAGHQQATAKGPSESCYTHYVGQVIFSLITCHLRSQPEGTPPPLSPVNTLCSLKNSYSPLLLRLLSRTLAGGLSSAWGSAGGGGDGRVAVRAAQWETQWKPPEIEVEPELWPLIRSSSSTPVTPSSNIPNNISNTPEKSKLEYRNSVRYSKPINYALSHKDVLPHALDEGSPSNEALVRLLNISSTTNASANFLKETTSVSLSQIVMVAAEQIRERRGNIAEAIRTSPHRLIKHVVAAQKSHLSGAK